MDSDNIIDPYILRNQCVKTPNSKGLYMEVIGNILLTIFYTWGVGYIGRQKIKLSQNSDRYSYFNWFYRLLLLAFLFRLVYFFSLLLYNFQRPNPIVIPNASEELSCSFGRYFFGILYYLFQNLTIMCVLPLTFLISYHWYNMVLKYKQSDDERERLLNIFIKVSKITLIISSFLYFSLQILQVIAFFLTEANDCNPQQVQKINGIDEDQQFQNLSYTLSKILILILNIIIIGYIFFFGYKMFELLNKLVSDKNSQFFEQQKKYRLNLSFLVGITFVSFSLYLLKILFTIIQKNTTNGDDDNDSDEIAYDLNEYLCKNFFFGGVIINFFETLVLEFVPLMIYSILVKPIRKDLKQFYRFRGKYKNFKEVINQTKNCDCDDNENDENNDSDSDQGFEDEESLKNDNYQNQDIDDDDNDDENDSDNDSAHFDSVRNSYTLSKLNKSNEFKRNKSISKYLLTSESSKTLNYVNSMEGNQNQIQDSDIMFKDSDIFNLEDFESLNQQQIKNNEQDIHEIIQEQKQRQQQQFQAVQLQHTDSQQFSEYSQQSQIQQKKDSSI